MENHQSPRLVLRSIFGFLLLSSSFSPPIAASVDTVSSIVSGEKDGVDAAPGKVYIIRVRPPADLVSTELDVLEKWYRTFLPPAVVSFKDDSRLLYAYRETLTGFAARLTDSELDHIKKKEGFLRAWEDRAMSLASTYSPAFLGLSRGRGLWGNSYMGRGVIIGVLDTGIMLDHPSFHDEGMPAPPSKWKGVCQSKGCNKKIIGSRTFDKAGGPMVDYYGHGTHVSATAAGNFVGRANVFGVANGTAAGMAPRAHLAMYKVCNEHQGDLECRRSDILAGMDAAIADGVDVLSLSLGHYVDHLHDDPVAIGAFKAVQKGIFVSCSAGNEGPQNHSLKNEAPWVLTVGASNTDRNLRATVTLGNKQSFYGETAYQPRQKNPAMLPLTFAGKNLSNCDQNSLQGVAQGKIALCPWGADMSAIGLSHAVREAGGAGVLVANLPSRGYTTFAEAHFLPAAHLSYADSLKVWKYMQTASNPKASITFKGTVFKVSPSPAVGFFSSRGPSVASPLILKPDIIGPGVNILAAFSLTVGPPELRDLVAPFNILSGTSMSTPHLSGVAALIKQVHPSWSPAAIKSALMTTSDMYGRSGRPISDEKHDPAIFFAMGAGHVNPSKAADPGLIFDLSPADYTPYLCGIGYSNQEVEQITQQRTNCAGVKKIDGSELNYPSVWVAAGVGEKTIQRTATNVGNAKATYSVKVQVIRGRFAMDVMPKKLSFVRLNEKKNFTVSMRWDKNAGLAEGNIVWVSGSFSVKYSVRIPVVIY